MAFALTAGGLPCKHVVMELVQRRLLRWLNKRQIAICAVRM
jgi:hypothetical protein